MNTRVILLGLALLCASVPVAGQGVDAPPHKDPRLLVAADVDPLMWPIVQRVNQSGWLWTTESCEGHGAGMPVVLGLVTSDVGRLFAELRAAQAAELPDDGTEAEDPRGLRIMVSFFARPKVALGEYQVRLVSVQNHEDARRVLARLAERANGGD
jgi:hypothetical protein